VTGVTAGPAGWSRRGLLRTGGSLAVAAGLGCAAEGARGTATASPGPATADSGAVSSGTGQVRGFRSRPDLRPPATRVTTARGGTAPGLIVTGPYLSDAAQQGPMLTGADGDLVWFRPLSAHGSPAMRPFDVRVQRYRGKKVLTWFQGATVNGHGQGSYLVADSSYRTVAHLHAGNGYAGDLHEFLITDQGTALFTCYGRARADLTGVGGKADGTYFYGVVQEMDIATGTVLFQWRADAHIGLGESYAPVPRQAPWDPYHVNSVNVAADGNLIVSLRNTWAAYKIDRSSGRVLWRLGGKKSDFEVSPAARFAWQHHVTPHPGGAYTVFDNGSGGPGLRAESRSRGLLLAVDEQARKATLTRAYVHGSPRVLSPALGSVQLLPDGHVFVGWGQSPYATEYAPDGTVLYDLELEDGHTVSYRAFRAEWTGRPGGAPALAASAVPGGLELYVSWNGDTEVRHWRVLLGSARGQLSAHGTMARTGFETKIAVSRRASFVAVAGLDGRGRELGRSAVHAVPA
jgi:hypothetical protein